MPRLVVRSLASGLADALRHDRLDVPVVVVAVAGEVRVAHSDGEVLIRSSFEEDLDRFSSMFRERRPVQPLSETTGGELDRSFRYREYLKPPGFGREVGGIFVDRDLWGRGYLLREGGDPDFSSTDVALLKRIAPHVGAGLKAAALRSRATVEPVANDVPGVLTLNRCGRVVSHTPSVEYWLRDLHPAWSERRLPMAVRMVVSVLERTLKPRSARDSNLVPRLSVRARSGR